MIGRNVIGRIYRPKNIKNYLNGFTIETKFKSNFGGVKPININLYCKENAIFLVIDEISVFEKTNEILKKLEEFKLIDIESDNLIKPDYLYSKLTGNKILKNDEKGILIPMSYLDKNGDIKTIILSIYTTIIDNIEYIAFNMD